MRTTLSLDPDVARLVEDAMHRGRTSMKKVVNDALRRALTQPAVPRARYELPVHEATLGPGLDLTGFNRLADEVEDAAVIARSGRARP